MNRTLAHAAPQNGRLSLVTPEGVHLQLTPAGPALRAGAWLIDTLLWFFFVIVLINVFAGAGEKSGLGSGLIGLLLFVSYWGYPVLCEVYAGGRTLGKRLMKIRVCRADGLPVGWRESSLRNLLLVADFLPFLYASGLLFMLFDGQFRRIGDIVANTLVVHVDRTHVDRLGARQAMHLGEPAASPLPLMPDEQRTLLGLFEREKNIAPDRLRELGDIAAPLTGERGLESLGQLRRIAAGLMSPIIVNKAGR